MKNQAHRNVPGHPQPLIHQIGSSSISPDFPKVQRIMKGKHSRGIQVIASIEAAVTVWLRTLMKTDVRASSESGEMAG